MPNPQSDDLGSAWTTSTPPSKQSKARRNTTQDLANAWIQDRTDRGLNPRGRMADDPKAVPYPEQDRHLWDLEAIWGKQDDDPRTRRGRVG